MSWELDEDNRFEARHGDYRRDIDTDNAHLDLDGPDPLDLADMAADIADEIGRRGL